MPVSLCKSQPQHPGWSSCFIMVPSETILCIHWLEAVHTSLSADFLLSPTHLPNILWPLTLSVNREVVFVRENPSRSTVCETLRPAHLASAPKVTLTTLSSPSDACVAIGWCDLICADEQVRHMKGAAECVDRWVWSICAACAPYAPTTWALSCLVGNVIQQGRAFTAAAAWAPCLATVRGVTHSKSDCFLSFGRGPSWNTQRRLTARVPPSRSITPPFRRRFSPHISKHRHTRARVKPSSAMALLLVSIRHKDQIGDALRPGLFLADITQPRGLWRQDFVLRSFFACMVLMVMLLLMWFTGASHPPSCSPRFLDPGCKWLNSVFGMWKKRAEIWNAVAPLQHVILKKGMSLDMNELTKKRKEMKVFAYQKVSSFFFSTHKTPNTLKMRDSFASVGMQDVKFIYSMNHASLKSLWAISMLWWMRWIRKENGCTGHSNSE